MKRWVIFTVLFAVGVVALVAGIGWLLPKAHSASRTAQYAAAPEAVFAAISDVGQYPSWRSDVVTVELLPSDGGTMFREAGSSGQITYRIETLVPPARMVSRIADPSLPFGGTWTFEVVTAAGGGSALTITEDGEVYNPIFRFISHFFMSPTATIEIYQNDLATHLARAGQVHCP